MGVFMTSSFIVFTLLPCRGCWPVLVLRRPPVMKDKHRNSLKQRVLQKWSEDTGSLLSAQFAESRRLWLHKKWVAVPGLRKRVLVQTAGTDIVILVCYLFGGISYSFGRPVTHAK